MNGRLGHAIANICEDVAMRAASLAIAVRPMPPAPIKPAIEPPVEVDPVRKAREQVTYWRAAAAASVTDLDRMTNAFCLELAEDSLQHVIEEAESAA